METLIIMKQLKVEGFIVSRWQNIWLEGIHKNLELIQQVIFLVGIIAKEIQCSPCLYVMFWYLSVNICSYKIFDCRKLYF